MLDFFTLQTDQNAVNYQEFYGGGSTKTWTKPRGVSMVHFLLIGAGAGGRIGVAGSTGGAGGGSGAVTRWIGPAMFVPDVLRITIGAGGISNNAGGSTVLGYQLKSTAYSLLTAAGGASSTGGSSTSQTPFGAAGIYRSIAGQSGAALGTSANGTTLFVQGGGSGANSPSTAGFDSVPLYGYPSAIGGAAGVAGSAGYFITAPVMFGVGGGGGGGSAATGATGGNGGIGCGGGGGGFGTSAAGAGGKGGDGAAFVWSW